MTQKEKLLSKALKSPGSLRFGEAVVLAEYFGFVLARSKGSHHIFRKRGYENFLNLQNVNGMAKAYQVRQLLDAARDLGLIDR